MTILRAYPSRDALDRPRNRAADVLVFVGAAVLIWAIVRISTSIAVSFDETTAPATVSTDARELPYYAARSLLRMFAALLPDASVGGLAGLVELVYATNGRADLPVIADELNFEIDDLLPLVDAATMLDFSTVESGDVLLTDIGSRFTTADIQESKRIVADQTRHRAPLVRTICKGLAGSRDGTLRAGFFLDLLRRGFGPEDARRQLDIAIDWGRYAELYDYDTDSDRITADPAAQIFTSRSA